MSAHAAEFRRCLEAVDVVGVRRFWDHVYPHVPQPHTDGNVVVVIHYARTLTQSMPLRLRAYSHRWLLDHDLPSGLPDELKPRAERMYPRVVEGVGIAMKTSQLVPRWVVDGIQTAMSEAVLEAYADKRTDPAFVRARIMEARERQKKYYAEVLAGKN